MYAVLPRTIFFSYLTNKATLEEHFSNFLENISVGPSDRRSDSCSSGGSGKNKRLVCPITVIGLRL